MLHFESISTYQASVRRVLLGHALWVIHWSQDDSPRDLGPLTLDNVTRQRSIQGVKHLGNTSPSPVLFDHTESAFEDDKRQFTNSHFKNSYFGRELFTAWAFPLALLSSHGSAKQRNLKTCVIQKVLDRRSLQLCPPHVTASEISLDFTRGKSISEIIAKVFTDATSASQADSAARDGGWDRAETSRKVSVVTRRPLPIVASECGHHCAQFLGKEAGKPRRHTCPRSPAALELLGKGLHRLLVYFPNQAKSARKQLTAKCLFSRVQRRTFSEISARDRREDRSTENATVWRWTRIKAVMCQTVDSWTP
uniref:Uncharacterized protein n=1 Tax=Steinernema glaseri TaxID=37863 RepID=A0A1I8ABM9_9BILA